ncbi:MAG: HAMP domain-containing sensor histidine kinase [Alphaproteobacteria bacterium]
MDRNPDTAELRAADTRRREERIGAGLVNVLYTRMPVALVANVVNGILTTAILSHSIDKEALALWLGALVIVTMARAVLWFRYRKATPAPADAVKWGWMSAAGSALSGALWGSIAVLFFVPGAIVHHVFFAFVIGGMSAGAVGALSAFPPAFHLFVVPAMGPVIFMLLTQGSEIHVVMAAMLAVFSAALAVMARDMNAVQRETLGLRYDNDGLISTLLRANEDAQAATRAKSAFLASMSHELRTPLNAILGFSEIMRDELFGMLGAQYREYTVLVHESAQHLLDVITDILDASRAEAGTLAIEEEIVDPVEIVDNCVGIVAGSVAKKGLSLAAETGPGVPLLRADASRLRQIALNLLLNAVKFTPSGGIAVRLDRDDDGGVVLSVEDTGIGMSPADVATALEPFSQVDASMTRKFPGTGLGLPLARALTRLHGGDLAIDSQPGCGTRVTVRFPIERVVERRTGRNGNNGKAGKKGDGPRGAPPAGER